MAWKKGESGNRLGRPKHVMADGRSLSDYARDRSIDAFNVLIEVMEDKEASHRDRVLAANSILDRGLGRPRVDVGIEMKSDDAIASVLEQARRRAFEGKRCSAPTLRA